MIFHAWVHSSCSVNRLSLKIILHFTVVEMPTPILRGTWFKGSILPDHWEPIEEKEAEKIETGHQGCVRALVRNVISFA